MLIIMLCAAAVAALMLETLQAYAARDKIALAMDRAGNMAVSVSVRDDYRMEKLSRLDYETARGEFLGYLTGTLALRGAYPRYLFDNGSLRYELSFLELHITEEPPSIECSAEALLKPFSAAPWANAGYEIKLPVRSRTRNVRID